MLSVKIVYDDRVPRRVSGRFRIQSCSADQMACSSAPSTEPIDSELTVSARTIDTDVSGAAVASTTAEPQSPFRTEPSVKYAPFVCVVVVS